jgi:hypothetical protein
MKEDTRQVLRKKIKKMIDKEYIAPSAKRIQSLIKYFAVPKGVVDGVVQDWRIVFHAGANKLNDAVWTPSFGLPNINSLLRIVDENTLMMDRDMGEMFHNFQLHENTVLATGIDLAPLQFTKSECEHRYMCWQRNLMGFRPSPYNSIRLSLVIEEVIRGDRHDPLNPFQWQSVMLNLPGEATYSPSCSWLTKRRADNSLASDFVTFVDDQRVTGQGSQHVKEAGHAISTRESYLGLQDALRKLRAFDGATRPGAWAGVNVCVERDIGIVVMCSQDKWKRMQQICHHWLQKVAQGETALDFKQLRSDRGFLVYATQAYPAMKPYLKGFHLSFES